MSDEIQKAKDFVRGFNSSTEVIVKGIAEGMEFEDYLDYFEGENQDEMIDDLFATMELNPPESMKIVLLPTNQELVLV